MRHKTRCLVAPIFLLFLTALHLDAEPDSSFVCRAESNHIAAALDFLNMTPRDLGFAKDHAEPEIVSGKIRNLLYEPMEAPKMAKSILDGVVTDEADTMWDLVSDLLETAPSSASPTVPEDSTGNDWGDLDPALAGAVSAFRVNAERALHRLEAAFSGLNPDQKQGLAASALGDMFNAEDLKEVRALLRSAGLADDAVTAAIELGLDIDPAPGHERYVAAVRLIDFGALVDAGRILETGARQLKEAVDRIMRWPSTPRRFDTALGEIIVGTQGEDAYRDPALLIIDPAGDDLYQGDAGAANGLTEHGLSCVIDLEGSDRYHGRGILGPGAALFGVSVLFDLAGADSYQCDYAGQSGAAFGCTWLEDAGGDDVYRAHALSQAAAAVGVAVLRDLGGRDLYEVGFQGQAFAGVLSVGLLVDAEGNDRYIAGGRELDHERNPERYLSLSQGFAIGRRPVAGGGVAALVDLAGNDTYEADVYGQGVSYWYAAAFLLDAGGHDTYHVHQYGQGSGIHLSTGLLWDQSGNDKYTGFVLVQGNAHDYAVGMLIDEEGNDTYTADHHGQGRAINNSFALLMDSAGNDGYLARNNEGCQGVGDDGGPREYGSIALLLDLLGKDVYSCGATDGDRMQRPNFGLIYDVETDEEVKLQ
jgi:hypothetical protein